MLSIIANSRIRLGTATQSYADPVYNQIRKDNFNLFVCENSMKWDATEVTQGSITLNADAWNTINCAKAGSGLSIKGHCLAWHAQTPWWFSSLSQDAKTKAVQNHVLMLSQTLNGIVFKMDVVNEAIDDGSNRLRTFWDLQGGLGQIATCFKLAHQGNPSAVLVYNDYNITTLGPKSDAVFSMVSQLKSQGVPIDEVGFQTHEQAVYMNDAWFQSMDANIKRLIDLGVSVNLSEVDIRIDTLPVGMTMSDKYTIQATCFYKLFKTALKRINEITLWQFSSKYTWVYDFAGLPRDSGCPCPWGNSNEPLPAVAAIAQALKEVLQVTEPPPATPVGAIWQGFGAKLTAHPFVRTMQRVGAWSGPSLALLPNTRYTFDSWVVTPSSFGVTLCCGSRYTHLLENVRSGYVSVSFTTDASPSCLLYIEGPPASSTLYVGPPRLNYQVAEWHGFGCETAPLNGFLASQRAAAWCGPCIPLNKQTRYNLKTWVVSPGAFGITLCCGTQYQHIADSVQPGFIDVTFSTDSSDNCLVYFEGLAKSDDFIVGNPNLSVV